MKFAQPFRQDEIGEILTEGVRARVAERALCGRVEFDDAAEMIDRDDAVERSLQHARLAHPRGVAIGDRRAEQQARGGHDAEERLQQHQPLIAAPGGVRAKTMNGAPERNRRRQQVGEGRAGNAESNCRPDQKREDEVFQRIGRRAVEAPREHHQARDGERGDERADLDGVAPRHLARARLERQHRRDDEQVARGIAQPPCPPERAKRRPRLQPAGAQARHADRGADGRARERAQRDNPERAAKPAPRDRRADVAANEPRRDDRFERVADGDAECDCCGFMRRDVREERAEKNARPDVGAKQQQRGERQTGRRPHERHLFGRERHREAELRGNHIHDGHSE